MYQDEPMLVLGDEEYLAVNRQLVLLAALGAKTFAINNFARVLRIENPLYGMWMFNKAEIDGWIEVYPCDVHQPL